MIAEFAVLFFTFFCALNANFLLGLSSWSELQDQHLERAVELYDVNPLPRWPHKQSSPTKGVRYE